MSNDVVQDSIGAFEEVQKRSEAEPTTVIRIKARDLDYLSTQSRGFEPVHAVLSRVLYEHRELKDKG